MTAKCECDPAFMEIYSFTNISVLLVDSKQGHKVNALMKTKNLKFNVSNYWSGNSIGLRCSRGYGW